MQQTVTPSKMFDELRARSDNAWVFYAKPTDEQRSGWASTLEAGTINFWWHGRGEYGVGGAPYSRRMKQGDDVVMILGEQILATGSLAAGGDWKFVDVQGRRRWPILIEEVLPTPIARSMIEHGERIIPHSGTVCPLPSRSRATLNLIMMGKDARPLQEEADVAE